MRNRRWTIYGKMIATAVLAVLLVRALLVTSCFIPSSGMENSLYRGEGVLVSKWSYGLRLPFPSWIGYHRLLPSRPERGDVVLFNNPMPVCYHERLEQRELFISRCAGLPGDTLMLNKELTVVDGEVFSPDSKELYVYPSSDEEILLKALDSLGLTGNPLVGYAGGGNYIRSFSHYEFYLVSQRIGDVIPFAPLNSEGKQEKHPFVVPAKGKPVKVYPWNVRLLCNTILSHENRKADVSNDTLYIDGKQVTEFTFSKDYFWMVSNDPVNINDSRLFGFVPEDHLVGKAWRIWYPACKERFFQRVH